MKIHVMYIIKNEADIVEQSLEAVSKWSDFIYVFDNGSNDGTWEKVLSLSKRYQQIVPYKQESCLFRRSLQGQIFDKYQTNSSPGDWWCKVDADEFYIDDPRVFLAKVPRKYQAVWHATFQYYFTDRDLARYRTNPSLYSDDVPVHEKCRYYINNWSEQAFVRHSKNMIWYSNSEWPETIAHVYPVRIWMQHFQYRSPQQIQKRIDTRREAIVKGTAFPHEKRQDWAERILNRGKSTKNSATRTYLPESWEERVLDASSLNYDAHDGKLIPNEKMMPKLQPNGLSLLTRHLKYAIKRIMHIVPQV